MVGVRGEIDSTNVALVLVLVVVATAAFGGRGPAALSAVVAAISYEFFFTRPFDSLRINRADDVETTLILLAIALDRRSARGPCPSHSSGREPRS